MERERVSPRSGWQAELESVGFNFHSLDGGYWDESACYRFTALEVDALEAATAEVHEMSLAAVESIVKRGAFERFALTDWLAELVTESWRAKATTLYGRMDLRYDGKGPPKLLEYNADTPTSLLEASVIQWYWMQDVFPNADQFNSIHDRLIEAWKIFGAHMPEGIWFTSISGNVEDFMTVNYLRDTAIQAGMKTTYIEVERIGWNHGRQLFVDET